MIVAVFFNSFGVIRVDGNHVMRSLAWCGPGLIFHPLVIIELIGHFRISFSLFLKASLGAHPFI